MAGDDAVASVANGPADAVLVDSPEPGSGRVFDWSLAEGVPGGHPAPARRWSRPAQRRRCDPPGPALGRRRLAAGSRPSPVRAARTRASSAASSRRPGRRATSSSADGWTPGERSGSAPYDWQIDDLRRRLTPDAFLASRSWHVPAPQRSCNVPRTGRGLPRTPAAPAGRPRIMGRLPVPGVARCPCPFAARPSNSTRPAPSRRLAAASSDFGGRFVPETLVPALAGARARVPRRVGLRRVPGRVRRSCSRATRAGRRRSRSATGSRDRLGVRVLAQARGPDPHRLPQDQQRARPGAADPPDGQAAGHRRDRRGPARRGHRDRRRAVRARLHGLHGRGRRRTPGAERVADAAARRRGRSGASRAARRSRTRSTRRCATGSRRSRRRTTASDRSSGRIRTRGWCASSSGSSATRRARSAGRSSTAPIPTSSSPASAAGRTRWGRSPGSSTPTRRLVGVEAGGLGLESGRHGASVSRGVPGRAARRALAVPPGRGRPDPRGALDQRRPRLPGRRPGARRARRRRAAPSTTRPPTTRRSPASSCWR